MNSNIPTEIYVAGILSVGIIVGVLIYFNRQFALYEKKAAIEEEQRMEEIQEEDLEQMEKERKYYQCRGVAFNTYKLNWNSECSSRGLVDDCRLPAFVATELSDRLTNEYELCNERHK